jgi:hypothetical protein
MATLAVQWRPSIEELRLIALGDVACGMLGWAARRLYDRHGLQGAETPDFAVFADLELKGAASWNLSFVTPWLIGKGSRQVCVNPDAAGVAFELCKAMRSRARKLTALCVRDETCQRLGSHLTDHVARALLPSGIAVDEVRVEAEILSLGSRGNGSAFQALAWSGEAILRVEADVLPWLSLVATCGGGENADKGFGGIELTPLP